MKKRIFTDDEIKEIHDLYIDRSVKTQYICDKFHISQGTLMNLIDDIGAPRRQKISKRIKKKRRHHCGADIVTKGAKFCPFCGTNIMTEAEIIQQDLKKLIQLTECLPSSDRDNFRDTILKAVAFIGKENNHD